MNNEEKINLTNIRNILYAIKECSTFQESKDFTYSAISEVEKLLSSIGKKDNETLELSELKQEKEFLMQTITTINKLTNAR